MQNSLCRLCFVYMEPLCRPDYLSRSSIVPPWGLKSKMYFHDRWDVFRLLPSCRAEMPFAES